MKLSNFELINTEGSSALDKVFRASVDVETGMFWWKKKTRVEIRREYAGHWRFVDTGKLTPGEQAEELAYSWTAKTGQET